MSIQSTTFDMPDGYESKRLGTACQVLRSLNPLPLRVYEITAGHHRATWDKSKLKFKFNEANTLLALKDFHDFVLEGIQIAATTYNKSASVVITEQAFKDDGVIFIARVAVVVDSVEERHIRNFSEDGRVKELFSPHYSFLHHSDRGMYEHNDVSRAAIALISCFRNIEVPPVQSAKLRRPKMKTFSSNMVTLARIEADEAQVARSSEESKKPKRPRKNSIEPSAKEENLDIPGAEEDDEEVLQRQHAEPETEYVVFKAWTHKTLAQNINQVRERGAVSLCGGICAGKDGVRNVYYQAALIEKRIAHLFREM